MKGLREDLVKIVHGDLDKYTSVLFCGSGTINIDVAINSLLPEGKKVLVVNNGAYSTRAVEICQYYGLPHIDLKFPVDQRPDLTVVEETLKEIQNALELVATTVETKLREVSSRTLDKLREMDANIADSLNPVIPTSSALKWADVFKSVSISGDNSIPINKRGSGVKRLVLLNFFRAEAERRAHETGDKGVIYAIEEPETSQHSANQRMLIEAFKSLAALDNSQVILTSHSAFLVKQLDFANLRLIVENENEIKEIRSVLPGQLQYPSLNEVNYLAFDEVTEEYHDELWSYIEFQQWKNEYISGQPTRPYNQIFKDGSIQNKTGDFGQLDTVASVAEFVEKYL